MYLPHCDGAFLLMLLTTQTLLPIDSEPTYKAVGNGTSLAEGMLDANPSFSERRLWSQARTAPRITSGNTSWVSFNGSSTVLGANVLHAESVGLESDAPCSVRCTPWAISNLWVSSSSELVITALLDGTGVFCLLGPARHFLDACCGADDAMKFCCCCTGADIEAALCFTRGYTSVTAELKDVVEERRLECTCSVTAEQKDAVEERRFERAGSVAAEQKDVLEERHLECTGPMCVACATGLLVSANDPFCG